MKYTFSANEKLSDALRAYADANLLDVQDAIRSILTLHLTGRCGVVPQPAAQATRATAPEAVAPAPARGPGRPSPVSDEINRLKAIEDDKALTEELKRVGVLPKDGDDLLDATSMHDKRYYRHAVVRLADGTRSLKLSLVDPKAPDAPPSYVNYAYADEASMWAAFRKQVKV